jgi:hypothetical protein
MKALTLTQPWATEPVVFEALARRRGNEAMHWFPAYPVGVVVATCELAEVCRIFAPDAEGRPLLFPASMASPEYGEGRIVTDATEIALGDYTPGRYAFVLRNVRAFAHPIPEKGALGLWEWQPK